MLILGHHDYPDAPRLESHPSTLIVCDLVGFVPCLVFGFLDADAVFGHPHRRRPDLQLNVICFSFMFALLEMLKRSGVFEQAARKAQQRQ
ncbi:MAG: hypothetical protein ACLTG4_09050 [Oscillospiraceae bacterium]